MQNIRAKERKEMLGAMTESLIESFKKLGPFIFLKSLTYRESDESCSSENEASSNPSEEGIRLLSIFNNKEVFSSLDIYQSLEDLDQYLSTLGRSICADKVSDNNKEQFSELITTCISSELIAFYLKAMEGSLEESYVFSQNELFFIEILVRNVTSFGIWKSVFNAKNRKEEFGQEDERAYVEAVALDFKGGIIATGFRGEIAEKPKFHAEQVLIEKLANMEVDFSEVIVCTNLEPCGKRKQQNSLSLAGDLRGCSSRLRDRGVKIVGYALKDTNPSGNGESLSFLQSNGMLVLRANIEEAKQMAKETQVYGHFC